MEPVGTGPARVSQGRAVSRVHFWVVRGMGCVPIKGHARMVNVSVMRTIMEMIVNLTFVKLN